MEADTLIDAIARLRELGFTHDLSASEDGLLVCGECAVAEDPAVVTIDHTLRFEGDSDPGDEAILLAVTCQCGAQGIYTAAYGAATPAADTAVLARLAHR